jgi:hypothetical protein
VDLPQRGWVDQPATRLHPAFEPASARMLRASCEDN